MENQKPANSYTGTNTVQQQRPSNSDIHITFLKNCRIFNSKFSTQKNN